MGLSEALSDDGSVTGRGGPLRRGTITGVATGLGGMLHTFPFLIPNLGIALKLAYAVVVCELIAIAFIRYRFMSPTPSSKSSSGAGSYLQSAYGSAASVRPERAWRQRDRYLL